MAQSQHTRVRHSCWGSKALTFFFPYPLWKLSNLVLQTENYLQNRGDGLSNWDSLLLSRSSSVPSTYIRRLPTTCNFGSREPSAPSWPPGQPTSTYPSRHRTYTHILFLKKFNLFKNYKNREFSNLHFQQWRESHNIECYVLSLKPWT